MARRPKHFSAKSRQIRLSFRGFNINYVPSAPPLYATLHTENDHIRSRKSKVGEKFRRKKREKILWVHGKCVTLQRFRRETGRLAQLVQSVCLTSRGSGVRIPQRPPQTPSVTRQRSPRIFFAPARAGIRRPSEGTNTQSRTKTHLYTYIYEHSHHRSHDQGAGTTAPAAA